MDVMVKLLLYQVMGLKVQINVTWIIDLPWYVEWKMFTALEVGMWE